MPIIKIPIVKKFGIISHTYQLQLQEKLAKEASEALKRSRKKEMRRNPVHITEEFVKKFNCTQELKEKGRLITIAQQMLSWNKRKVGFNTMGSGSNVNLSAGWTDLVLLAQCKGIIQDGALDILLTSLDHAPFDPDQISCLFFLAETVLYWIFADAIQQPYLYSSEIKIIKLGFLVFLRLFIFHKVGLLEDFKDHKAYLCVYLKDLPECETSYQPYPNVLLTVQFIIRIGEVICSFSKPTESESSDDSDEELDRKLHGMFNTDRVNEFQQKESGINPVLCDCLLIWFCVQHNIRQLDNVLQHLLLLRDQLCEANWIDSLLALLLLSEAAKMNMACFKVLTDLASNMIEIQPPILLEDSVEREDPHVWPWQLGHIYSCMLGDICLYGINTEIQKSALIGLGNPSNRPKQLLHTGGLLELLEYCPSTAPDPGLKIEGCCGQQRLPLNKKNQVCNMSTEEKEREDTVSPDSINSDHDSSWFICYGAAYSLAKVCQILTGDKNREGLRYAAWSALRKQSWKHNSGMLTAIKIAEAELNGPINPCINGNLKISASPRSLSAAPHIGYRIGSILSQLYLPSVVPHLPVPQLPPQRAPLPRQPKIEKKMSGLTLREEIMLPEAIYQAPPSFNVRTSFDLRRIMEDQWRKELQVKLEEEEENREIELQDKMQKEIWKEGESSQNINDTLNSSHNEM
ncbi:transmembrane protein 232 [Callorhinchus milii]|nr:transmembrane protein 232 [Callorhinchus milii]